MIINAELRGRRVKRECVNCHEKFEAGIAHSKWSSHCDKCAPERVRWKRNAYTRQRSGR